MISIAIFVCVVCVLVIGYLCMTILRMKEERIKRERVLEEDERRLDVLEELCAREFMEEERLKYDIVRHYNMNKGFVFGRLKTPFRLTDFDESSGSECFSIICFSIVLVSSIYLFILFYYYYIYF